MSTPSRSQLRLRCRRGMLELDIMLRHYLEHHYPSASEEEQLLFLELLDLQDPPLYQLLTAQTTSRFSAIRDKITGYRE